MTLRIRVTSYSFDRAKLQDMVRLTEERLIRVVRQLPGCGRYTGAGERATDRGVVLTECDDLDHAETLRTPISGLVQETADLGLHLDTAQIYALFTQAVR
jgi:hypothetical protein